MINIIFLGREGTGVPLLLKFFVVLSMKQWWVRVQEDA